MTPSQIVAHLQRYLPRETDLFSDMVSVSSASVSGNTLTVNATAHGLTVGRQVSIVSGTTRNSIVSYTDNGDGTARFEVAAEHDLTQPLNPLDQETLTLAGFAAPWNGTHEIVSIPSRTTFEIAIPTGAGTPSGGYLVEDRVYGLVGVGTIATATANAFTVTLDGPSYPASIVDGIKIIKAMRVAGAADIDRAQKAYGSYSKSLVHALYVIMTDNNTSKDRNTQSDAILASQPGTMRRLTRVQRFSVVAFIPTEDDVSGYKAQQKAYGVIDSALNQTLFGAFSSNGGFQAVPTGHGVGVYNSAYYSHVYEYEVPEHLDFTNGFIDRQDVAFRDIDGLELLPFDDDQSILSVVVDIDEGA